MYKKTFNNNDYIKRMKLKIGLYGSYTREFEDVQRKYYDILEENAMNNFPKNAARNTGYKNNDPRHTAVSNMIIDEASMENIMKNIIKERSKIGIDNLVDGLEDVERKLLFKIFVDGLTYKSAGLKVGMSESTVHRTLKKIINIDSQHHAF